MRPLQRESESASAERDPLAPRVLVRRALVGAAVFVVLVAVLGSLVRDPLTAVSAQFVDHFGLGGVFAGVLFTDSAPMPLVHEPLLLAAYAGGLGFLNVCAVGGVASVLAGVVGWGLGRLIGRVRFVQRLFASYGVDAFFRRYGRLGVAVAALTPFPFSFATWAAGAGGLSLSGLLWGAMFRMPKVFVYMSIAVFGWDVLPRWFGG